VLVLFSLCGTIDLFHRLVSPWYVFSTKTFYQEVAGDGTFFVGGQLGF